MHVQLGLGVKFLGLRDCVGQKATSTESPALSGFRYQMSISSQIDRDQNRGGAHESKTTVSGQHRASASRLQIEQYLLPLKLPISVHGLGIRTRRTASIVLPSAIPEVSAMQPSPITRKNLQQRLAPRAPFEGAPEAPQPGRRYKPRSWCSGSGTSEPGWSSYKSCITLSTIDYGKKWYIPFYG